VVDMNRRSLCSMLLFLNDCDAGRGLHSFTFQLNLSRF